MIGVAFADPRLVVTGFGWRLQTVGVTLLGAAASLAGWIDGGMSDPIGVVVVTICLALIVLQLRVRVAVVGDSLVYRALFRRSVYPLGDIARVSTKAYQGWMSYAEGSSLLKSIRIDLVDGRSFPCEGVATLPRYAERDAKRLNDLISGNSTATGGDRGAPDLGGERGD